MSVIDRIIIRPIKPHEQNEAKDLILSGLRERWGFIDPMKNPDLCNIISNYLRGAFLVALLEGSIIGTGALLPEDRSKCRIVRMSVKNELRSRGIGTTVLNALIQTAQFMDFDQILLETTATWIDAVTFYQKRGFHSLGIWDGDHHFLKDIRNLQEL
jgi:ribosomal protein S18 acetylase RimI-like enzyme